MWNLVIHYSMWGFFDSKITLFFRLESSFSSYHSIWIIPSQGHVTLSARCEKHLPNRYSSVESSLSHSVSIDPRENPSRVRKNLQVPSQERRNLTKSKMYPLSITSYYSGIYKMISEEINLQPRRRRNVQPRMNEWIEKCQVHFS